MKALVLWAAGAAALGLGSAAAVAAEDAGGGVERHRAAFAGAVLRVELGARRGAKAPLARLGIGYSDYRRDGGGALVSRSGPRLALEAGLADGRVRGFVGGEAMAGLEHRLGAGGSTKKTLLVVGGIAVGAAAALLLLDGDGDDGPCPPGVEVCAQ